MPRPRMTARMSAGGFRRTVNLNSSVTASESLISSRKRSRSPDSSRDEQSALKKQKSDAPAATKAKPDAESVLKGQEADLMCPICFDYMVGCHVTNPCGHAACWKCVDTWFKQMARPTCFVCRTVVDRKAPSVQCRAMDNVIEKNVASLGDNGEQDWIPTAARRKEWEQRKTEWTQQRARLEAEASRKRAELEREQQAYRAYEEAELHWDDYRAAMPGEFAPPLDEEDLEEDEVFVANREHRAYNPYHANREHMVYDPALLEPNLVAQFRRAEHVDAPRRPWVPVPGQVRARARLIDRGIWSDPGLEDLDRLYEERVLPVGTRRLRSLSPVSDSEPPNFARDEGDGDLEEDGDGVHYDDEFITDEEEEAAVSSQVATVTEDDYKDEFLSDDEDPSEDHSARADSHPPQNSADDEEEEEEEEDMYDSDGDDELPYVQTPLFRIPRPAYVQTPLFRIPRPGPPSDGSSLAADYRARYGRSWRDA